MKLSKFVHAMSMLVGTVGAFALLGAWIAGGNGTFWGAAQSTWFNYAIVLELMAIFGIVCTLVRMQLERDNPGSSPLL